MQILSLYPNHHTNFLRTLCKNEMKTEPLITLQTILKHFIFKSKYVANIWLLMILLINLYWNKANIMKQKLIVILNIQMFC